MASKSLALKNGLITKLCSVLIIPLLSIVYGLGELNGWWDHLSGRSTLIKCYSRLSDGTGYPTGWIYDDEPEFKTLKDFLAAHSNNPQIAALQMQGLEPSLISVDGGGESKWQVPSDWPVAASVPREAQLLFCYGVIRGHEKQIGKVAWAGSLYEFDAWIKADVEKQRFWVTIVLMSILGAVFGWIDVRKDRRP